MKLRSFFSLIVLFAIALIGCESDALTQDPNDPTGPNGSTWEVSSVQEYFDQLAPDELTFNVDLSTGGTFTTPRGSTIDVDAGQFLDGNGQVATGTATIHFREIFTKRDMLTTGISTIAGQRPLNSGGAFFLGVTQNGQNLQLALNQFVDVTIPAQATSPTMQLFSGDSLGAGSNSSWILDTAGTGGGQRMIYDPINDVYQVLATLQWVNCDDFVSGTIVNGVNFDLLGVQGLNSNNSIAAAYIPSMNSLWRMNAWGGATFQNSQMLNYSLPSIPLNVVVVSYINQKMYYGVTSITPVGGTTYPIQMNQVTQSDLNAFLASL